MNKMKTAKSTGEQFASWAASVPPLGQSDDSTSVPITVTLPNWVWLEVTAAAALNQITLGDAVSVWLNQSREVLANWKNEEFLICDGDEAGGKAVAA